MGAKNSKVKKGDPGVGSVLAGEKVGPESPSVPARQCGTLPASAKISVKQTEEEVAVPAGENINKSGTLPANLNRSTSFSKRFRNSARAWAKDKGLLKEKEGVVNDATDSIDNGKAEPVGEPKQNGINITPEKEEKNVVEESSDEEKKEVVKAHTKVVQMRARAKFFEEMYNTPEKPKRTDIHSMGDSMVTSTPITEHSLGKVEALIKQVEESESRNNSLDFDVNSTTPEPCKAEEEVTVTSPKEEPPIVPTDTSLEDTSAPKVDIESVPAPKEEIVPELCSLPVAECQAEIASEGEEPASSGDTPLLKEDQDVEITLHGEEPVIDKEDIESVNTQKVELVDEIIVPEVENYAEIASQVEEPVIESSSDDTSLQKEDQDLEIASHEEEPVIDKEDIESVTTQKDELVNEKISVPEVNNDSEIASKEEELVIVNSSGDTPVSKEEQDFEITSHGEEPVIDISSERSTEANKENESLVATAEDEPVINVPVPDLKDDSQPTEVDINEVNEVDTFGENIEDSDVEEINEEPCDNRSTDSHQDDEQRDENKEESDIEEVNEESTNNHQEEEEDEETEKLINTDIIEEKTQENLVVESTEKVIVDHDPVDMKLEAQTEDKRSVESSGGTSTDEGILGSDDDEKKLKKNASEDFEGVTVQAADSCEALSDQV